MSDFKKNMISVIRQELRDTYARGMKQGVTMFAWWKDGTQYVGTCGMTLKKALSTIDDLKSKKEISHDTKSDEGID